MTDRAQFEAMLEALINEDQETAKEIFHNIVVAKSREIYEELLESDFSEAGEAIPGEEEEAPVAEAGDEEESGSEEEEGSADDEEGADDFGGDDEGGDEFGGEEEGEDLSDEEQTDRILDLEDALDELKAEFEQMMAGDHGGEHDDMGGDEFGGDEFGADDLDAELDEFDGGMGAPEEQPVMEYVNKVTPPKHGDNGANTKSIVAGKNDMGGTTANIAKSFSTTSGGTQGGLLKPSTTKQDAGNVNVPGGKSATKLTPVKGGHGAEKKGSGPGPVGAGKGDKAGQTSVGKVLSPINGAPNRAK